MMLIPAVSAFSNDIQAIVPAQTDMAGMTESGIISDNSLLTPVQTFAETYPFKEDGSSIDLEKLAETAFRGDTITYQAGQFTTLAPPFQAFVSSSAQSPLATFSPAVQTGGQVSVQFGIGAESDVSFHESLSAEGQINSFSYQGIFTSG